ncbi:MAG: nucleotidyltransferase family protein [Nitrospira sp.]|nr:nucleotidyltransferase family protein [Nitrospira sp.]
MSEFARVEVEDLVSDGVDWEVVWQLSRAHGVTPLVYRNLLAICPKAMPSAIHEAFRRHNQANVLLNTLLARELVMLVDALTAKGIKAIPFKGVTLAQAAYGDLTLRECADIDLIVEQEAIPQARKVLWSQGYQLTSRDTDKGAESEEPYHFFQKRNGIVAVDLQWMMARRHFGFRLDRIEFYGRLKPVRLPAKSVMGLAPEDLLILLCVHGTKHAWEQLKWICDVAELVRRRPALDWSRVLFQAEEWGCRRILLLGLGLAQELFETVLPRVVLHELEAEKDIPLLIRSMPKQLLKSPDHGIDESCAEALYMMVKDSAWERWKLAVDLCRAEADVLTHFLPWFRFQPGLRILSNCLKPIRRVVAGSFLSIRMRRTIVRWLQISG